MVGNSLRLGLTGVIGLLLGMLAACQAAPTPETPAPQEPTLEVFQLPPTWTPTPQTALGPEANRMATLAAPATWTPEPTRLLPASLTPLPTLDPNATSVAGYCYQADEACEISVRIAMRRNWCQLSSAAESCGLVYDYSLQYPQGWIADTIGAQRPNLTFNTGTGNSQVGLFQLPAGILNLDSVEQAQFCNENGDCVPVVSADETIVRRREKIYAGRNMVLLTSTLADRFIARYFMFLEHGAGDVRLYILEMRLPSNLVDSDEYLLLLDQGEIMLGSIQPDTEVEITASAPIETGTPEASQTPGPIPSATP